MNLVYWFNFLSPQIAPINLLQANQTLLEHKKIILNSPQLSPLSSLLQWRGTQTRKTWWWRKSWKRKREVREGEKRLSLFLPLMRERARIKRRERVRNIEGRGRRERNGMEISAREGEEEDDGNGEDGREGGREGRKGGSLPPTDNMQIKPDNI